MRLTRQTWRWGVMVLACVVSMRMASLGWAEEAQAVMILADFNDGQRNTAMRNNRNGSFQTWTVNADCTCRQEMISEDALGLATGRALQLAYSVSCPPHFNGWFMFLDPDARVGADLSGYDRLGLFVKGTTSFVIEVKDRTSRDDGSPYGVAQYTIAQVGPQWRQVEIPFTAFTPKDVGDFDWSGVRQLVIVFSDIKSYLEGSVLIDQMYVSRGPVAFPWAQGTPTTSN